MPKFIASPSIIEAAGNKTKIIEEYFGRKNSNTESVSIAHMKSPQGWVEPGQQPEFDEYTIVLKGGVTVQTKNDLFRVNSGEAILIEAGEWVQYSTPDDGGAEYIAVCLPAFSPDIVHRDDT